MFGSVFWMISDLLRKHIYNCKIYSQIGSFESSLRMTCNQFITFHRSLLNKRYEENDTNINPFGNLLFTQNWNWANIFPIPSLKIKPNTQKNSIKIDILSWFNDLSIEQKSSCIVINNLNFIQQLLKVYPKYISNNLYNLPTQKKLPDLLPSYDDNFLKLLYDHTKMSWTNQPIIWIQSTQIIFSELVDWMQKVSNGKIFQYAHKINNRNDPQENLLWFNSLSFHRMESWLVNQFQKMIIKNYSNKNFNQMEKIQNLKYYLDDKGLAKESALLSVSLKDCSIQMFQSPIRQSLKKHEENYIDKIQEKLMNDIDMKSSPKKKKNKKKKTKKNATMPVLLTSKNSNENVQQNKSQYEQKLQIQNQNKSQIKQIQIDESQKTLIDIVKQEERQEKQISIIRSDIAQNLDCRRQAKSRDHQQFQLGQQYRNNYLNSRDMDAIESLQNKHSLTPVANKYFIDDQQTSHQLKKSMLSEDNNLCDKNQDNSGDSYSPSSIDNKSQTLIASQPKQEQSNWEEQNVMIGGGQNRKRKKKKIGAKKETSLPQKQLSQKVCSMLLNRQLNNFIDGLSIQTNQLYECKVVAFERVRFFIKSLFSSAQAILFGSNAVGLSLPSSDIDIMIFNLPCKYRQQANEILAQVAIQINAMGWIHSCSTYLNAKVPIVKLQIDPSVAYLQTKRKSDYTGLLDPRYAYFLELKDKTKVKSIKVDLTINLHQQCHTGAQSTQLMKKWMSDYPMMHRILIALKYILAHRGLNQNFKGGIGSYCLFVMVAAFIRQCQLNETPVQHQSSLFLNVLKFYGQDFENQLKCIKLVEEGSCYQPISTNQIRYNYDSLPQLCIFDPINGRMLSGSFYQYNTIKAQFRRIRNEILQQQIAIEKQMAFCCSPNELNKMITNKKSIQRWMHKYQIRSGFCIQKIIDGR